MTLDMRREIAYDVGATTHGHNSIGIPPATGYSPVWLHTTDAARGGLCIAWRV